MKAFFCNNYLVYFKVFESTVCSKRFTVAIKTNLKCVCRSVGLSKFRALETHLCLEVNQCLCKAIIIHVVGLLQNPLHYEPQAKWQFLVSLWANKSLHWLSFDLFIHLRRLVLGGFRWRIVLIQPNCCCTRRRAHSPHNFCSLVSSNNGSMWNCVLYSVVEYWTKINCRA